MWLDLEITISISDFGFFALQDLLNESIKIVHEHGSMLIFGILVVEQDATLPFLDEGAIDVVGVGLHYLLYLSDPREIV